MSIPAACYVDAPGFGGAVTMTQTRDYTSPDGKTRTTGTATFTWHRVKLSDLAAAPKKSPVGDLTAVTVGTAQFLAFASAFGRMPGWTLTFGAQDPIPDAFSTTVTAPDGTPTTSTAPAYASLSASTVSAAPGRPVLFTAQNSGSNGIPSFNGGEGGGDNAPQVTLTVALVQSSRAATATGAAVGPVYRVTLLPPDCNLAGPRYGDPVGERAFVMYNGQKFPAPDENGTTGLYSLYSLPGTVFLRAANVADVLLDYGDTLGGGSSPITYERFKPSDTLRINGALTKPIDNPFPMQGQSFASGPDAQGSSVTVQF